MQKVIDASFLPVQQHLAVKKSAVLLFGEMNTFIRSKCRQGNNNNNNNMHIK